MAAHREKPRPAHRWRRRILVFIGVLILLLLIYPLWFPWVLKPVAGALGAQFQGYNREGYSRIELSDVQWTNRGVTVSAERLDVQLPHLWLLDRLTETTNEEPQIVMKDWRFESRPSEPPTSHPSSSKIDSIPKLLETVQIRLPSYRAWFHYITATNGALDLQGKETQVPDLRWREGRLAAQARGYHLAANFQRLASGVAQLSISNAQLAAVVRLSRTNSAWHCAGDLLWESNRFELAGLFARTNWLPVSARLGSDTISLPPRLIGLQGISDLHGSAQVVWTNGSYSFEGHLQGERLGTADWIPSQITANLAGEGDLSELTVQTLAIEMPHLNAALNRPLTLGLSGPAAGQQTTFDLSADLTQMESVPLNGQLSGKVALEPESTNRLHARFHLEGTSLSGFGVQTKSAQIAGSLNWPVLQITNISARFASGATLSADAQLNLAERRIAHMRWQFDGLLPLELTNNIRLGEVHGGGTFQGTWPDLSHTGRVQVANVRAGGLRARQARLEWTGQQLALDHLRADLESGASTLALEGGSDFTSAHGNVTANLELTRLDLKSSAGKWSLANPAQFHLHHGTNRTDLELTPLELADEDSRIALQAVLHWPSNATAHVTLTNLHSADVSDFLASDLPTVTVPAARLNLQWNGGPLTFDSSVNARWQQASNSVWAVACNAASDGKRLQVDGARLKRNDSPVLECDADLPLRIAPTPKPQLKITDSGAPATVDVRVLAEDPFWQWIAGLTGVRIQQPHIEFHAQGPLDTLQADLSVNAGHVEWTRPLLATNAPPPALDDLRLDAAVGLKELTITRATARLRGQPLELEGQWKLGATNWLNWLAAVRAFDLNDITGKLKLRQAELSSLVVFVPGTIAPVGKIDVDLELKPGVKIDGHVDITNAATRALVPLGTVRNIDADIDLNGWAATVNGIHATMGGRPVFVSGQGEWRPKEGLQFDLNLGGTNLSLLHDPDLIVRADLDLRVQKDYGKVARVTGDVGLRRSLLFRDFSSMVSRNTERPTERPPYFSLQAEPFAEWQLKVHVKGDRFMHVLSTAFKGEVSADLDLSGSLREPIAVGEVAVDDGRVLFPFGTLEVERARVSLLRENPYRPQLDVVAQGQNFGYNVTINVEGPADEPRVVMQSVPPLTTQQILLMLTAGEVPRSDFGYSSVDKVSRVGYYLGKEFINRFLGNTSASERLVVRSGQNITDEGKPTYSIEYKFTDRWSVFGEYNRFQDLNSGLKFKVLSK